MRIVAAILLIKKRCVDAFDVMNWEKARVRVRTRNMYIIVFFLPYSFLFRRFSKVSERGETLRDPVTFQISCRRRNFYAISRTPWRDGHREIIRIIIAYV